MFMNAVKRPNSRRNLDIAIERMAKEHADPLRIRAALAAAVVAQKLHAASAPGSRRAHDLIDLQLIARNTGNLNYELLRKTCVRLFAYRKQQGWPPIVAEGETWSETYRIASEGLDVLPTVEEAVAWTNAFIQKIDAAKQ